MYIIIEYILNIISILRKTIRLVQKLYYEKLFAKFKNGTWKAINEILNRSKRKKNVFHSFG